MKTRLISAAVAALIAVPLVYVGGFYFSFGVGLLAMLGYKELIDLRKSHQPLPKLMIFFGLVNFPKFFKFVYGSRAFLPNRYFKFNCVINANGLFSR